MFQTGPNNRTGPKFRCLLALLLAISSYAVAQESKPTKQRQNNQLKTDQTDRRIHLEGIEDLDHLAYLSLRNYNLTDELLLQPTWFSNGNQLDTGQRIRDDSATASLAFGDPNNRLASMLESLVLHLKNGHLRRLTLDELAQIVNAQNLTEPLELMRERRRKTLGPKRQNSNSVQQEEVQASSGFDELLPGGDQTHLRCLMLVTLYKSELMERVRSTPTSLSNLHQVKSDELESLHPINNDTNRIVEKRLADSEQVDEWRLLKLCELAVNCNSADDLVDLISEPWKRTRSGSVTRAGSKHMEREFVPLTGTSSDRSESLQSVENSREVEEATETSSLKLRHRKQLHDSVSLSLTKLCPLILFPLHEVDGQCLVRRDDRPPIIRVWAFATLFVTIVCFCSLIGLSITPLIGHLSSDSSPVESSSANGNSGGFKFWPSFQWGSHRSNQKKNDSTGNDKHKASLTLFEGLAVGSLVGSALFSLLPQAFELQERESNQSFLLKAFIIFSGIYLFFLSERIMRIILDTRQKRKRKRRLLTHRSSTTQAAVEATANPHYEHHHQHLTGHQQDQSQRHQRLYPIFTTNNQERNSMALVNTTATDTYKRNSGASPLAFSQQQPKTSRETKTTGPEVTSKQRARKRATINEDADRDYRPRTNRRHTVSNRKAYKQGQRRFSTNKSRSNRNQSQPAERRRAQRSRQMRQESSRKEDSSSPKLTCSSSSLSCSSTSSSFSSYVQKEEDRSRLATHRAGVLADSRASDSQATYSSPTNSDSESVASICSSCLVERCPTALLPINNFSDSDDDNNQRRAVTKRMSELTHHLVASNTRGSSNAKPRERGEIGSFTEQQQVDPFKTSLAFSHPDQSHLVDRLEVLSQRDKKSSGHWRKSKQRDISTVAWMIILGDGLHNFIDGISIGAAFSESILSGISISVAVICEEFPHELGDFAVLISSGMTIREALGYNFLSASTCYLGMAIGIILGDVTDGASYISALAAGVFLYIALVDMMGELSAALESSSRYSIAHTLKLLLLQNVGIAIGISIIFVLSFIDF